MRNWSFILFVFASLAVVAFGEEAEVHASGETNEVISVQACDHKLNEHTNRIRQLEQDLQQANDYKQKLLEDINGLRTSLDRARKQVSDVEEQAQGDLKAAQEAFKGLQAETRQSGSRIAELEAALQMAEIEIKNLESLTIFKSLQSELKQLLAKFRTVLTKIIKKTPTQQT